jgi:peptidoglycan-N-acetylglucosamine deacetylase
LIGGGLISALRRAAGAGALPPAFVSLCGLVSGAGFAALYYPPYARRRATDTTVYLTFDDGPSPEVTPRILEALAAAGAHASFFVLGEAAVANPELVWRIADEGHTIGIHGYNHRGVTFQAPDQIECELSAALHAVRAAGVEEPVALFRPTYGLRGPGLGTALHRVGLSMKLWTLDSRDYLTHNPELIRERLGASLQPGDVILCHDDGPAGTATAEALPDILLDLHGRGLRCDRLPE